MHRNYFPIILPILFCFALGEWSRYAYNLISMLGLLKTGAGRFLGHLRWNFFLVLYPVGAFGDGLCGVFTIPVIKETVPMLFSCSMPNKMNFAFNFSYFLTILPFLYMAQFPINYLHLIRKRRQFYAAEAFYQEVKATKTD